MKSKLGIIFAGTYLAISLLLILTQGLFGESFIAIILGLPWSLGFAYFEYFSANEVFLYILMLAPIALNAFLLYSIGEIFGNHKLRL